MSSPYIWILIPGLISIILFIIHRRQRLTAILGILACLVLAALAWAIPIGRPVSLGPWAFLPTIQLADSWSVLGRQFILENSARPFLILIYLGLAFWFGGAIVTRAGSLFVPFGLAMGCVLTATLAVEPFLYAALLIELAALVSIPLLIPPGRPVSAGVLRFLIFQTLGLPFILLAGWLMTGVGSEPTDPIFLLRVISLLGLGFGLYMAIFPFHTWIPMVMEESHPYRAAFVIFVLPLVGALFAISFLEQYTWLHSIPGLLIALRLIGILMVVYGGIWSVFQKHLGRMLGFAVVVEIGYMLLVISATGNGIAQTGVSDSAQFVSGFFYAQLLPYSVALGLWALALAIIRIKSQKLDFTSVAGMGRTFPIAAIGIIIAQFSIAGLPLLGAFPLRLTVWTTVAKDNFLSSILLLLGSAGLIAAGIRAIAVLFGPQEQQSWKVTESRPQLWLLTISIFFMLLIGILPQFIFPMFINFTMLLGSGAP